MRQVTTDDTGEASFEFAPPTSGSYRLVAESTDDEGRVARSARFVWVSGRDHAPWPVRDDDIIELIADRDEYEVGDVAEVLVPAPFAGATALVTIERGRVLSSEVRTFETNSEVLRIPIEDAHIPNVFVGVVLYRAPTADDPYPRYLVGTVELSVSTAPRHLDVRVEPDRDAAAPGETVQYEVTVTDAEGVGVASGRLGRHRRQGRARVGVRARARRDGVVLVRARTRRAHRLVAVGPGRPLERDVPRR